VNGQYDTCAADMPRQHGWLATLRSFARPAGPRARPSWRAVGADIALAVTAAVASLIALLVTMRHQLPGLVIMRDHGVLVLEPGPAPQLPLLALLGIAATTVPLALRRVRPLAAFCVVFVSIMLTSSYMTAVTFIVVILSAYSAVVHSPFRGLALLTVPAAGAVAGVAFQNTTPPLPGRFTALLVLTLVALVGNATQLWRRRAGDSQARIAGMQAEHEAATRQAIELERARVASELHDVVTHSVSVMVVQAGAARKVLRASPGEATTALLAVEESGRAAMTELRHLLGLLAPAGDPEAAGAADGDDALLRPQPGLGQIRPLIDRVAATGLPVELDIAGPPRVLPPGLDLAAYRVVQEALTNVMKHAAHARTAVRLDYRPGELVIEVSNDQPARDTVTATAQPGSRSGRGLLGLRERVELYGGKLDTGHRPGGGWRVLARLPLDPATAPALAR
jgi:signal transduction histidine kinase